MKSLRKEKGGFTLLEVLLVVGIIAILAGIVIVAINPTKQLGDSRNAKRRADVASILNAVYQYAIDNNGNVPTGIIDGSSCAWASATAVCTESTTDSTCNVDLDTYLASSTGLYLTSIPTDPLATSSGEGTGYTIYKDATSDRITVCAPLAEQSASISVTR